MVLVTLIESVYNFLWGDLLTLPLGGVTLNLSLMVILLFTAGIYFTLRTRLLPMRLFRDMLDAVCEKKQGKQGGLSSLQTLVVSTAVPEVVETPTDTGNGDEGDSTIEESWWPSADGTHQIHQLTDGTMWNENGQRCDAQGNPL